MAFWLGSHSVHISTEGNQFTSGILQTQYCGLIISTEVRARNLATASKRTQNYPWISSQTHVNSFPILKTTPELPFPPLLTLLHPSELPDLGRDISEIATTMGFPL